IARSGGTCPVFRQFNLYCGWLGSFKMKSHFKDTLLRMFLLCGGIAVVAVSLVGKSPYGLRLPLWWRATGMAMGFLLIYVSLIYYLPKYRKMREELSKELDEAEKELDKMEGKMRPHDN